MLHFFLSFKGNIRPKIESLKTKLEEKNFNVFYDKARSSDLWGKQVDKKLNENIKNSKFFVIFFEFEKTKENIKEKKSWQDVELDYARSRRLDGFILPVIIGEDDKDKIDGFLDGKGLSSNMGYETYIELNEQAIKEIVEKLKTIIDENPPIINKKNYDFQIAVDRSKYKELYNEVQLLESKNPKVYTRSMFFVYREDSITLLTEILNKYGIALIHGPQGIGKTYFINSFLSTENYEILESFNSDKVYQELLELYADWTKGLIVELLAKFGLKSTDIRLDSYIENFLASPQRLIRVLENDYCDYSRNSYFESIKHTIEKVFNHLKGITGKNIKFVIEITIDNFEKLLNKLLIQPFHEDCLKFFNKHKDNKINKGMKFIIISRFFPINRPYGMTLNLTKFSPAEIKNIFSPIVILENIIPPDNFYHNIFKLTNGYQWFVIRLLRTYLKIRQSPTNDKFTIWDIAKKPDYWINENEFEVIKDLKSRFIETILGIIESNFREDDNNEFILIINRMIEAKNNFDRIKKEINMHIGNPILMESGILDYSYNRRGTGKDKINGYGNFIIQEYVIKELFQDLSDD